VIAITDVSDDHFAAVNADTEADRLAQIMLEKFVQFVDIGSDHRRRLERLAAGFLATAGEPEQRQHAVTDKLVRPAAAFDHRLRHRAEESIDDENGVERQTLFSKLG